MVELSIIHTNSPVLKTVLHLSNVFLEIKIKKISPIVFQIFHYRVFAVCACDPSTLQFRGMFDMETRRF